MSSETKFTPGPWEITRYVNYEGFSVSANEIGCIAERWWPSQLSPEHNEQASANSRLIAAAPELYAALEAIESSWFNTLHEDSPLRIAARAALAKARGEA